MADELTVSAQISFSKSNASMAVNRTATLDVSGSKYAEFIQNIGTTREDIVFGDIGTPGYFIVQNADPTNYIELSSDGGTTYSIKLTAGSSTKLGGLSIISNNGVTWSARANTAACNLIVSALPP